MTRKTLLISIVLICLMVLTACSPASTRPTPHAKMPNPAAVHGEQNGGQLELRQDAAGGITGVCVFPNGPISVASVGQHTE
jgi:putative hemolysin